MRISDWSSDVCSSDLVRAAGDEAGKGLGEIAVGDGKGGGDGEGAEATADQVLRQPRHRVEAAEDGGGLRENCLGFGRRLQAAGDAHEELHLELALAVLNRKSTRLNSSH